MSKIKIVIVDDDPVWLNGMETFINEADDISVIATALSKEEALQVIENHEIDIILMDINLGRGDEGIYLTAEIAEKKGIKTIMLTVLDNEAIIIDSFTAGAINYIQKENYQEIPAAIRSAYHKASPIEVLVKDYGRLKEAEQLKLLSAAEKELLELIQKGYSQSQMARMLYKSIGTIKSQVNTILKKLGVNSSKEALKKIRWKGLLK
jgi:two-component system response regulator DevR